MADIFEIAGRIHSTSQEHVISPADEILDTSQNKKQHLINSDVARHESEINSPTNGLNKRVADIEALGQIGDTPVETNASNIISNTSLNGKVPSASAVNGVYNAVVANAGCYTCDSEASTAAKVVEASGYVLTVGGCIKIKMTNDNTADDDATLNINSTGAKALYYAGERASATNSWEEGETVEVYYDGTSYHANNVAGGSGSGDGAFDVSAKYPTSGVEGGNTYTLEGALAVLNANLSASKKKGGMSIKFISSIDNKYVQYRLMADTFSTTESDWQGVESTLTVSDNIPSSKAALNEIYGLFISEVKDKNIKVVKELYLIGLADNTDYYIRTYIQGDVKRVQIRNADNTATVASGDITDTFVTLSESSSSGISGFAVLTTTEIWNISLSNVSKINVNNVKNINNSPVIKEKLYIESIVIAGSDKPVKSSAILNEIYSLFFADIPDKNIKQIKELYLTGLNPANEYLVRLSISGTSKILAIRDSNNETTLAAAAITNDVFVVVDEYNDSGISGYAILTTTDIIHIALSDCAKINVQNVSNIDLSPSIKERLAINYPKFDDSNSLLKDSGLAGKFYGYPFFVPEYSQRNDVIMSAIKELYLTGIDKKEIYYVRYHIYNDRKYIHIYDNTKTAVAAAVYDGNNLCYVWDSNSSGIKGYVLVDGIILDSAASSNEYIVLANEYALDKMYSPIIQNRTKFIDITPISGPNYDTFALGIQELYITGINDTDTYTIRVNVGTAKTFQIFNSSNTVVARGIMADDGKVVKLFPYNSAIHGYIIYNGTISATTSKMNIVNVAAKDKNNSPIIQRFLITDPITVGKSSGFYDYISLTKAVIETTKEFDKIIYVDEGVYDLEQEFKDYYGNDYFDNWTYDGATELGLMLKNRVHIIFSSKAKVVFNYTGNNADVMEWWSPFNAMPYTSDCYGFTLENMVLEASNCRYCVHDERNAQTDYYVNKYINCSMKIDNTNNTAKVNYSCLGGGLGKNGYIEIVSCKFEAVGLNTARNIFSYHNSKNSSAKSRLVIKDNYCVGLGTFKLSWHGTSTEITEALVCGNSFGSQIICAAETGTDVTENVSITAWNNEIRTT